MAAATIVTMTGGEISLRAKVFRPNGAGRHPAVIICPGGIGTGSFEIMDWLAQAICDVGVVVATISYRSGSPLNDPDDIVLAVDWLASQPDVDQSRIGIAGISRGGGAALRGAARDKRIRACAVFGPLTNIVQQLEGAAVYAPTRYRLLVGWVGDLDTNRAFCEKVQALSIADQIKQPVLFVHGANDMHTPIEQSIWMKEAIEAGGNRQVAMEVIPNMGHYGDVPPATYGFATLAPLFTAFFQRELD
jgi:dipeptidyl aminopeptidase/acylaminoacyl peptidase